MTLFIAAAICAAGISQVEGATGLYAALLRERYHGTPASQMVVKDTTIPMRALRASSSEWLRQFDEVPLELRRAASRPSPTKPQRLDRSLLPAGTRLVPAQDVETIFTGPDPEANWLTFRTQFKSRGWLAFSDGLLSGDRLNALVYYEAGCSGLCGEGGYVWLHRDTVSAPWRIAKKIVSWMS